MIARTEFERELRVLTMRVLSLDVQIGALTIERAAVERVIEDLRRQHEEVAG